MMRKRSEWVESAVTIGVVIYACLIGVLLVAYIRGNFPQWEAPAVFVSLGLSVLPALWYWRVRRYGWVVVLISSPLLATSMFLAFFHGWVAQVIALYAIASVTFLVVIVIAFARIRRRLESAMRDIGEDIFGDPLFKPAILFRDDGQRIAVYPKRHRLVINCAIYIAILGGICALFILWRRTGSVSIRAVVIWVLVGLLACLMVNYLLAHIYRLMDRKPTLIVGPDGIFDDGLFIWSGLGVLRWTEILAVTPDARKQGFATYHYLSILVTDLPAIRRRLPILKRLGVRVAAYTSFSALLVPQWMLETAVDDLATQINHYAKTHAPPGWFDAEAQKGASENYDDTGA